MLRKALFTVSLIGLSFSGSNLTASEYSSHDALIIAIVANADDCVMGYIDEKIYLNAEKIIPTGEGLFLDLNGLDFMALPSLYSDQGGCYIAGGYDPRVKTTCPECGKKYTFYCQTEGCPRNPKSKKGNN